MDNIVEFGLNLHNRYGIVCVVELSFVLRSTQLQKPTQKINGPWGKVDTEVVLWNMKFHKHFNKTTRKIYERFCQQSLKVKRKLSDIFEL